MRLPKSVLPAGMDKLRSSVTNICRNPEDSRLYILKDLNVCIHTQGGHLCHLLMTWAYGAALAGSVAGLIQSLLLNSRFADIQYSQ